MSNDNVTYSDFLTEEIKEVEKAIVTIEELEDQIKVIYNTISERSYERK